LIVVALTSEGLPSRPDLIVPSRDLIKSRALSAQERSAVVDGTANKDRSLRANEQNLLLADIFKHSPIDFDAEGDLGLKGLLDVVAIKRGRVPVSDNFVNSLDGPTREWLAAFIREP
jgi:hypothetical protein